MTKWYRVEPFRIQIAKDCNQLSVPHIELLTLVKTADGTNNNPYLCTELRLMQQVASTSKNFVIGMRGDYQYLLFTHNEKVFVTPLGLEPKTHGLKIRCSTF